MYCSDRNVGKTRVNKFFSNKKNKSQNVQKRKLNNSFEKLKLLQINLLKEELSQDEYEDYNQNKIDLKKAHYVGLTQDNIDELNKLYAKKIKKKENKLKITMEKHELNQTKRMDFTKKKTQIVNEKRTVLIQKILKELKSCNSVGVSRNISNLSDDVEKWSETKKFLFLGGRYLESSDKDWCKLYDLFYKNDHCLFNLKDKKDFHNFIKNRV